MKCPVCTSKQAKRACLLTTSSICSLCCGTNRNKESCHLCGYYQDPKRDYASIPCFTPNEMSSRSRRLKIAYAVEYAISSFDDEHNDSIKDELAIRILEHLLDFYHFKQQNGNIKDELLTSGYEYVLSALNQELKNETHEDITKIVAGIYVIAKRRSQGRREYLDFIRQYVGV